MTVLIFDFDGTIADTLATIVNITNRLAAQYGYPQTTPERLKYLRTLSTGELLAQSNVPLFQVPFLVRRVRQELRRDMDSIQPFQHLADVLQAFAADGHKILIASSNAPSTINPFLKRHGLSQVFRHVYGNIGLLGKARSLRRIMRHHRLLSEEILYIGDETRDIEAARCQGVAVAAVSWGFSDRTALEAQGPTFLVDTPEDLYRAVAEFHRSQWRSSMVMGSKRGETAETPSYVHHGAD
ncbi:HAD hydrolase-like protein [Leptothoe sp. PORK10 BA2]|uniref:HAD hydrolase-like protein n=1 Tax=Leptothoe sp. PORK10 BA2 TaxID=3110254 RepID=UPI002B21E71E|nr:HAD hydrolase-like protein [Leptothoe sp. PORK10 BA2]MEA5466206.1 HAD hydrolase-like protein [Leptothoe sp. PORK10 BA2]